MNHPLFVYGTLLQADNKLAYYLKTHCTSLQPGKLKGTLYDIGDYPGLIISNVSTFVYGHLYEIDTETLTLIDDYEGFGAEQEQPNLYLRKLFLIEASVETIQAWVYVYNRPAAGFPTITDGDYLKYLAQKKSSGL
ncbi:gamma-glutamylcyclotransferase [Mucilaginibacter sp.]|uniref:gamma-glutamylcyclotransferase family protein n=1 Tax=Mucilaginibacter sp. TaxID=1882438 RepID=UPI0035BC32AE